VRLAANGRLIGCLLRGLLRMVASGCACLLAGEGEALRHAGADKRSGVQPRSKALCPGLTNGASGTGRCWVPLEGVGLILEALLS